MTFSGLANLEMDTLCMVSTIASHDSHLQDSHKGPSCFVIMPAFLFGLHSSSWNTCYLLFWWLPKSLKYFKTYLMTLELISFPSFVPIKLLLSPCKKSMQSLVYFNTLSNFQWHTTPLQIGWNLWITNRFRPIKKVACVVSFSIKLLFLRQAWLYWCTRDNGAFNGKQVFTGIWLDSRNQR